MIFGDRVRLRAISRADTPYFLLWLNDPEIRANLRAFEPLSEMAEERWVASLPDRVHDKVFAIEAQLDEQWLLVGTVGLHAIDYKDRHAEFGLIIGDKQHWGKGFGSDATRAMLRWGFGELNLHRIELEVYEFNVRARRMYERVGFAHEGVRRQCYYHDGRYFDSYRMSVLKQEILPAVTP